MVDLQEPLKRSYSEIEQEEVKAKFFLLVHHFLFLYLALHNLLIPLALNLFRGRFILEDVHFWFLFQLPVSWWLRRNKSVPSNYLLFLVLGSLVRLGMYNTLFFSKSWSLLSVYLSEISTLIFCFIIWPRVRREKVMIWFLSGGVITASLSFVEKRAPLARIQNPEKIEVANYQSLGCQGSSVNLEFPIKIPVVGHEALIDCGFRKNLVVRGEKFYISHLRSAPLNLRLYQLTKREGRFSWKFIRMKRIESKENWNVGELMKERHMYLLKSPENRSLGMMVILPRESGFTGRFEFNFDGLSWSEI